jgi:small multidrug resistance pump
MRHGKDKRGFFVSGSRSSAPSPAAHPQPWSPLVNHLYLIVAICAEVAGTTALKASEGFTRLGPSAIVVITYGIAFFFLALTLRTIPVGVAYAIWSGCGIVLISLVGWVFYRQNLDWPAIAGITLILAGVVLINLFSGTAGK